MTEEIEKIYVIPLKKRGFKSSRSAHTAVKRVKIYLTKHMKVEEKNIWIDDSLNNAIWKKGKYNIVSKIRVKAVKFEDGVVEAYLPELEFKKSRRELLKEEKEKKEPILKKEEEEEPTEESEVGGAEDYNITPTGDGEVKIKKKKTPKEKEEKPAEKAKPKKAEEKKPEKKTATETKKEKKPAKASSKKAPAKVEKKKSTKSKSTKATPKKDKK